MKLIIGLGNPKTKYEKTRHNLGFRAIDELRKNLEFKSWNSAKKFKSLISQGNFNNQKIILAKPQTFMNNSGPTVKDLAGYYKIKPKDILVIHDDIDLALEEFRIQVNRGSAGHKGVQSIIDALGTKNFTRIRIGLRPKSQNRKIDTEGFVLEKFTENEEEIIGRMIEMVSKKTAEIILAAV